MYKLILVCLALVAVASAQYLASPYAYSNLGYRSGAVYSAGYPAAYGYNTGAYAPYAYGGYGGLLYK